MRVCGALAAGGLLLIAARVAFADAGVIVRAELDRTEALVGEPVRLSVVIRCPEGWTPVAPQVGAQLGQRQPELSESEVAPPGEAMLSPEPPPLAGLTVEGSGVETDGPPERLRAWWRLAAERAGTYAVPPLSAACRSVSEPPRWADSEPLTLTVRSLLPADWASQDIRGPKRPIWRMTWVWWLVLAALIAGAIGWWVWRRRRPAAKPAPPRPAHEIALAALQALERDRLVERGQFDPWSVQLSSIVRRYVEDRFALRAPEMTTEEFLQEASRSAALSPAHRHLMRDFLQQCDLVKFARYQPSDREAQDAVEAAKRFIQDTAPKSSPTEPAGVASR